MSLDVSEAAISESQPITESSSAVGFATYGLTSEVLRGIRDVGFTAPSEIQEHAVPEIMLGRDIIAQAKTGSGKTAAFIVPILSKLKRDKTVEVVVLVPTRELCQQVVDEFEKLGKHVRCGIVSVVGGQSGFRQIEQVNRGASIIVATPGRLLDHLSSNKLKRFDPKVVVIDEADEMLDKGFIVDIRKILGFTPSERQTLMFSATMPAPIVRLADDVLRNPVQIKLDAGKQAHADIEQIFYLLRPHERDQALIRLLQSEDLQKAVVFCRTKQDTSEVYGMLRKAGFNARALHGDMTQGDRSRATQSVSVGDTRILVATDIASRGLDIDSLTHVINYHLPEQGERYTHRIGRTGRAGRKGRAISLVTPADLRSLHYLRSSGRDAIEFQELPTAASTQQLIDRRLVAEVLETNLPEGGDVNLEDLLSPDEMRDFACRAFAFMRRGQAITGPERIGFGKDEARRASTSPRTRRDGGGGGRGRGRSQRSYSGGGRSHSDNRQQGGGRIRRYQAPPRSRG